MNVVAAVSSLAAATSHEINNPLMVVIARLELLARTQGLDAGARTHLEAALAAAHEIKKKVHWLGWITRLELADGGLGLPPMLDLEKSSQR
jgi:signal transduction histidine kinase